MGEVVSINAKKRRKIDTPRGILMVDPERDEGVDWVTMYYDRVTELAYVSYFISAKSFETAQSLYVETAMPAIKRKERLYRSSGVFDKYNR